MKDIIDAYLDEKREKERITIIVDKMNLEKAKKMIEKKKISTSKLFDILLKAFIGVEKQDE